MQSDIVIVITARTTSERLPKKVLKKLGDFTDLEIQVLRASRLGVPVIISMPRGENTLAKYARALPSVAKVFEGSPDDVVAQVYAAAKSFGPKVVVRGLPDCPFFDYDAAMWRAEALLRNLIASATRSQHRFGKEPVYGSDEPAYSWGLVEHMLGVADDFEREHFGAYVDRHRGNLNVLYTPPVALNLYRDAGRPFRLELDTEEDAVMLEKLVSAVGPLASPQSAVWYLELHPEVARINSEVSQRTGPTVSFGEFARDHERSLRESFPIGDGDLRLSLAEGLVPVLCDSGKCFVGYRDPAGDDLVMLSGVRLSRGSVSCRCGKGRKWRR